MVADLQAGRLTIGRRPENDIVLEDDAAVSKRHAELELVAGSWFVLDLDSTNGTFVNGVRIAAKKALHVGDELRVGDTSLWLQGAVTSEPMATTSPAVKPPSLTVKQRQVLVELTRPQANDTRAPCSTTKEVAARLFVGEAAIKAHLSALYLKFDIPEEGLQRRALLAKRAWETGAVQRRDFEDAPIQ